MAYERKKTVREQILALLSDARPRTAAQLADTISYPLESAGGFTTPSYGSVVAELSNPWARHELVRTKRGRSYYYTIAPIKETPKK